MYILFVDESGTPPNKPTTNQRYFVLAGLVVPAAEWKKLHDRLHGLKVRHGLRGELKWRYFAPGNKDADNPMLAMSFEERDQIRVQALQIVPSIKSLRVIASVVSISAIFGVRGVKGAEDVYRLAYKTLSERFQYYLQDLSRTTGSEHYGMIVSDHRSADRDRGLRAHHQQLVDTSRSVFSTYSNLIETLFFAPSHLSTGIQFADLVAGSVWRKFERDDERCYKLIESSIRSSPAGTVDGFGIIRTPKAGWK